VLCVWVLLVACCVLLLCVGGDVVVCVVGGCCGGVVVVCAVLLLVVLRVSSLSLSLVFGLRVTVVVGVGCCWCCYCGCCCCWCCWRVCGVGVGRVGMCVWSLVYARCWLCVCVGVWWLVLVVVVLLRLCDVGVRWRSVVLVLCACVLLFGRLRV